MCTMFMIGSMEMYKCYYTYCQNVRIIIIITLPKVYIDVSANWG